MIVAFVGLTLLGVLLDENDDPSRDSISESRPSSPSQAKADSAVDKRKIKNDTHSKRYQLTLTSTRRGQDVVVRGKTNLPNGAVVDVTVSRVSRHSSEKENRATHAAGTTAVVNGGAFSTVINRIDDSDLALGIEPDLFGPLAEIDSHLTVCTEFYTGQEDGKSRQPTADVRSEVGASGERLRNSAQASEFGSATKHPSWMLEAQTSVLYPVAGLSDIAAAQGSQPVVHPLNSRFCG